MFSKAYSFRGVGVERWNTNYVTITNGMFASSCMCLIANQNPNFYDGERTISLIEMSFNANISNWDVGKVEYLLGMFRDAILFKGIGISQWDMGNCLDMSHMFNSAISFNANISSWNVRKFESMDKMFFNATSFVGQVLESWDVSRVHNV
jgi:Mycoplasma protein of unknown function, DUF285